MKTREDLLSEISLASRITREPRLLALLSDIKVYLESITPGSHVQPSLEPKEGRLPRREIQLRRNAYMRIFMRKRRAKQKETKLAIINSTSNNPGFGADIPAGSDDRTAQEPEKAPWEDE